MTINRNLSKFAAKVTSSGTYDIVEDTSPQLGGDLDVNGNAIVSASNGNIAITPNGSGKVILDGLSHPTADGSAGHVLKTDGSGNLSFASVGSLSGSGIQDVVDDTSPQLGGNLDVQAREINTSTTNGNVKLNPNGTGCVEVMGDGSSSGTTGAIQLNCSNNNHGVKIQSPPHSAGATYTLTLPTGTGSNGQALTTNGSGVLSFSTISTTTDLNALSAGTINTANDSIAFIDADDSNNSKKESVADFLTAIAGSGISVSGNQLTASGGGGGGGGGATGGGSDEVFYENDQTVTTNYTITASHNAVTAGPITVNNGITITVPSGARWVVV